VADDVELADSISIAMLLVMETLTPTERAVFVLREVFGLDYDEVAQAVERVPPLYVSSSARPQAAWPRCPPLPPRGGDPSRCRALVTVEDNLVVDCLCLAVLDGGGDSLAPVAGAVAAEEDRLEALSAPMVPPTRAPRQVIESRQAGHD
jgi:hypothetical protein